MMKRIFPLLLLVIGCTDRLFGPSATESIAVELDGERVRETTLLVGERVRLAVAFTGRGGDARPVDWRSERADVATVEPGGEVAGLGFGNTRIIATVGALADTIFVTVLSAPPHGGHCGSGEGLRLARGEAYTTTAASAESLCIAAGTTSEQYVLVPFHAATGGSALRVEITATDITGLASSEATPPAAEAIPLGQSAAEPTRSWEFDRLLREREARELAPLVTRSGPTRAPALAISPAKVPSPGDRLTLNVNAQKSCSGAVNRQARVAAVSERALVLHDTQNPTGFTDAEYQSFATNFDAVVYPTLVENFGAPTDIDGNGRVLLLFTRAVNEMTAPTAETYVAGFFFSRDLFPRSDAGGLKGCSASNVAEILYLMVPDPGGQVNGVVRTREFVKERTIGVIAHELQHLVSASRRLRTLGIENWNEEFWLNEGLSHIAEELAFYTASSLRPGMEINLAALPFGSVALSSFNQMQSTNFARYGAYLRAPGGASSVSGLDMATRGASWAFLRYAADRRGGAEAELWRKLIDSPALGYANLGSALGVSPLSWVHDWAVSLYTDDLISQVAPRFRQPSWNFRSLMPNIPGVGNTYPLLVKDLAGALPRTELELAPGGAAIVRFLISGGRRTRIQTTSGWASPPPNLRLTLVRTR